METCDRMTTTLCLRENNGHVSLGYMIKKQDGGVGGGGGVSESAGPPRLERRRRQQVVQPLRNPEPAKATKIRAAQMKLMCGHH